MLQTHIIRENGLYDTPALFLFSGEHFLTYIPHTRGIGKFLATYDSLFCIRINLHAKVKIRYDISIAKFSVQSHLRSVGVVNSDLVWNHILDNWCTQIQT